MEKANAVEAIGASVARGGNVIEGGMAIGQFSAINIGPREKFRDEYIKIRRQAEELYLKGKHIAARMLLTSYDWMLEPKWNEDFANTVMNEGKNHMLEAGLRTTTTVVGPFLGLISSASYASVPVVGDTMASHATWTEAGTTNAPQWTSPASGARGAPTMAAASAGSMAFSSAVSFSISTSGTIKGCFLVTGTGAVATNLSTAGKLWSAGLFAADKVVSNGDTLSVSYSTSL